MAYKGQEDPKKYPYPSRFGSHQSMVDEAKTEELNNEKRVVCLDEYGHYETDKSRLDDGLADINRYRNRGEKLLPENSAKK